jgi:preprotein translocase subunit SecE
MTRIESGVTVPKDLFTLYVNVKIVMAKIFWPPSTSTVIMTHLPSNFCECKPRLTILKPVKSFTEHCKLLALKIAFPKSEESIEY